MTACVMASNASAVRKPRTPGYTSPGADIDAMPAVAQVA